MMKRTGILAAALALLTVAGCATQQQAEQRAQTRQAVSQAIDIRQLHIDIHSMHTQRYGARTVATDFFLELRGDTLISYLPYLGQSHQALLTSPIGLNFTAPVLHYAASPLKYNGTQLEIDVKTQEDNYKYILDVYDTGEANIRVSSLHRDPISFDGNVAF